MKQKISEPLVTSFASLFHCIEIDMSNLTNKKYYEYLAIHTSTECIASIMQNDVDRPWLPLPV